MGIDLKSNNSNTNSSEMVIEGDILAPGISFGKAYYFDTRFTSSEIIEGKVYSNIENEMERLDREIERLKNDLEAAVKILQMDSLYEAAEIIKTHVLILEDRSIIGKIHEKIQKMHISAEMALDKVLKEIVKVLESSENEFVTRHTADIRDIMFRLKMNLKNEANDLLRNTLGNVQSPVIILRELFPSLVLEARELKLSGIIVIEGTSLSHAAILAKSFGIPVLRIPNIRQFVKNDGRYVVIDAFKGRLVLDPEKDTVAMVGRKRKNTVARYYNLPIGIWANILNPEQVTEELLSNTEGIGLYRTEFLFINHKKGFPDEETQFSVYASLLEKCSNSTVTIRTLDIGGDKKLPYFSFGPQENPFLGLRAHRIYRFHPDILVTQIRAILRAGVVGSKLRILFPMIESVDEFLFVKNIFLQAVESLNGSGLQYRKDYELGILIEVPSAVWSFKDLLQLVDFASIGTNDLFQYFYAVDRNNANIKYSYQPENPAALRMLKYLIDIAGEMKKPLSICGEIASDLYYLPLLVGLGVKNISIDFHMFNPVSEFLKDMNVSRLKKVVEECLHSTTVHEVQESLEKAGYPSRPQLHLNVPKEEIIDPVCHMAVHKEGNPYVVKKNGNTYYFCSKDCMVKFTTR